MEKAAKNSKAKDDKHKDPKIEEQVLKTLEGTIDEKFQLLLQKYVQSESSNRRLKSQEKLLENALREKENLQKDYMKCILMRDKLQDVCREQQKIIKSVKNESLQKLREEEERRKESQTKFQTALNEISVALNKNNEENLGLNQKNIEMSKKLQFLAEQYQIREQQLEKLNEQIKLEAELQKAKMSKVQLETTMEKEILIKEKQIALEKLAQSQKLLKELTEREISLREQLNIYTSKYDDFQSSLQKSNDIFATYKVEMEKMSKQTKKIEKEAMDWKRKYEKSNAKLIELAMEKEQRDEYAQRCGKQVDQLQKLLRALQHERSHLYKVLRENAIEIPPLPELPPEPEQMKTMQINTIKNGTGNEKDRMDMMSKNCAEIKETLANLQSQIKTLKLKENEAENALKDEKPGKFTATATGQDDASKKRNKKKQKGKNGGKNACCVASTSKEAAEADEGSPATTPSNGEDAAGIIENGEKADNDVVEDEKIVEVTENTKESDKTDNKESASCVENLDLATDIASFTTTKEVDEVISIPQATTDNDAIKVLPLEESPNESSNNEVK